MFGWSCENSVEVFLPVVVICTLNANENEAHFSDMHSFKSSGTQHSSKT